MEKINGTAAFYDKPAVTAEEIFARGYTGGKIIFGKDDFGGGDKAEETVKMLKNNGVLRVVVSGANAAFRDAAEKEQLAVVTLDKKSIEDIFRTFADKDSEAAVITNDDGTRKVKLISGSLSKSYQF
jgi:3-isopropylmalate/(R)-2-methylmalate dehydratase small subunit